MSSRATSRRLLRRILFILVTFSAISPHAAYSSVLVPLVYPKQCVESGPIPTPTGAAVVTYSTTNLTSTNYKVKSTFACAAIAKQLKALVYSYDYDNCTVYGAGAGSALLDAFFSFSDIPSPSTLEEVAFSKPTYCSSWLAAYVKELAVDGQIQESSMYISGTDLPFAWWVVDLQAERTIHQIQLFMRQACCHERFFDVEVRIGSVLKTDGNFSSYTLFAPYKGPYAVDRGHLLCSHYYGITGRYVSIQKVVADVRIVGAVLNFLQLVEVRVFARIV